MAEESTHIIFDGEKIIISSNLRSIIIFLKGIEVEAKSLFDIEKKHDSIRKQYIESLEVIQKLLKKLNDNKISVNITLVDDPSSMAEKLKLARPVRAETIVLFAYLETLICLNIAYENTTADEKIIINQAMNTKVVSAFIKDFCLNQKNDWCAKFPERANKICAKDIRYLRNALTHFFSVGRGLSLAHACLDDKSRKIEKLSKYQLKIISPEDLFEIINGSAKLMISKWSNDYKLCSINGLGEFKTKILAVKNVVEQYGANIITNEQINFIEKGGK